MKVKNCYGCPFKVTDVDYYSTGNDTLEYCNLIHYRNFYENTKDDYIIHTYDSWEEQIPEPPLPSACPLKKETLVIEL